MNFRTHLLFNLHQNKNKKIKLRIACTHKQESDSESDNDETVNSDYSEMKERAPTVGSGSTSSPSLSSAPVPTAFKPHRTKAEILTEIVSDNLVRFACDFVTIKFCIKIHRLLMCLTCHANRYSRKMPSNLCCQSYSSFFFLFFCFSLYLSLFSHPQHTQLRALFFRSFYFVCVFISTRSD